MRTQLPLAAALLAMTLPLGCGGGSDQVTTSVVIEITADGQPVTKGSVNLANPEAGTGGGGELDESGKVTIETVPMGEYTVTVLPPEPDPTPPEPGAPAPPNPDDGTIPQKYRSESTSPLRATVTEDDNKFQFALEE